MAVTDAQALSAWVTAVAQELGLPAELTTEAKTDEVLELTSVVAHSVDRPAAPVTAFLIGVAAGRADDPAVAARDYAEQITTMARGWDSAEERGAPAGDQAARG